MKRVLPVVLAAWLGAPIEALAYRPFDSTDAAVASPGDLELELGPLSYIRDAEGHFLVVPAVILNLGVARDWEVVLEGKQLVLLDSDRGPRWRLVDTGAFVKGVLRKGSLQDGHGPSVATELGVLLPTMHDEPGAGLRGTFIVSQRWDALTMHANGGLGLTRAGNIATIGGLIVEGPSRWLIRPVAEAVAEWEPSEWLASALVGAIWRVNEALSLDIGLRTGRANATSFQEVRAGLTYAVALWGEAPSG